MKKTLKQFASGTIIMLAVCGTKVVLAGERGGNGGDMVANHFYEIGTRTVVALKQLCSSVEEEICKDLSQYEDLVKKGVTVTSEAQVYGLDRKERDAVNNGKDQIIVSRTRWEEMEVSLTRNEKRVRLVIHEYLSNLGSEKSDEYTVSTRVVNSLKNNMFDLESIAGKYVKSSNTILEFKDVTPSGMPYVYFRANSNKDEVCVNVTKNAKATVVSFTEDTYVLSMGQLRSATLKNNRIKIHHMENVTTGTKIIRNINCLVP